jgi:hypothetical protein
MHRLGPRGSACDAVAQTDHVRSLHKDEMRRFRENENAAIARHARQIETIDLREALGPARESLLDRAIAGLTGNARYTRKADVVIDRCEAQRIARHSELEALKERQFAAAQEARVRHAQERKAIFELHRVERVQLTQAHARNRAPDVGLSQRAFVRAAQQKEQAQEQGNGRSRGY